MVASSGSKRPVSYSYETVPPLPGTTLRSAGAPKMRAYTPLSTMPSASSVAVTRSAARDEVRRVEGAAGGELDVGNVYLTDRAQRAARVESARLTRGLL
jgi:hypothetical protein